VGAILVNINPSYRRHELEYALRQSGCSLLVLAEGCKDADYRALLAEADAPGLRTHVVLGEGWDELLARADEVPVGALREREAELDFDEPINIQCSATSPSSRTAPAWSCPPRVTIRLPFSKPCKRSAAPRSTACRRCSSPSWASSVRAATA